MATIVKLIKSVFNTAPQNAPGSSAATGHSVDSSIPLSIFPITRDKFCICFCGLPGRGKTHIGRRLAQYLSFFYGVPVQIFHTAEYRRKICGPNKAPEWFDPKNEEGHKQRSNSEKVAQSELLEFLTTHENGIAIWDSTTPSRERRAGLVKLINSTGAIVMFIEVQNDDDVLPADFYRETVQMSPDYAGMDLKEAETDYRRRIELYKSFYEPLDQNSADPVESKWSYLKCNHSHQDFVVHNVKGYLQQKVVNFIMNMRTTSHAFYLCRHGQSEYNALQRIGGDSGLTEDGKLYAEALARFVQDKIMKDADGKDVPARLWTSTMRRTRETAQYIPQTTLLIESPDDPQLHFEWIQMRARAWHHLDELFAGACDGMTYEEIEERYPEEWARRQQDKLAYRYPRGESYLDVIARLEPIIIEMERHQEPLVIIAHQGILRIIYAFYMGLSRTEAPFVNIKLNNVIELVPAAYGCSQKHHFIHSSNESDNLDGQQERVEAPTAPVAPQTDAVEDNNAVTKGPSSLESRPSSPIVNNSSPISSSLKKKYFFNDDPQSH